MAVTRKPQPANPATVRSLIRKGGSSGAGNGAAEDRKQVVVFIPEKTLEGIDELIDDIKPRISRREWLLAAAEEKLQRDRGRAAGA